MFRCSIGMIYRLVSCLGERLATFSVLSGKILVKECVKSDTLLIRYERRRWGFKYLKFLFAIMSFDFESTRRYYLLSVKIVLRVSICYLYFTRRDGIYDNKGDNILQFSKPNVLYLILIESTSIISSRASIHLVITMEFITKKKIYNHFSFLHQLYINYLRSFSTSNFKSWKFTLIT